MIIDFVIYSQHENINVIEYFYRELYLPHPLSAQDLSCISFLGQSFLSISGPGFEHFLVREWDPWPQVLLHSVHLDHGVHSSSPTIRCWGKYYFLAQLYKIMLFIFTGIYTSNSITYATKNIIMHSAFMWGWITQVSVSKLFRVINSYTLFVLSTSAFYLEPCLANFGADPESTVSRNACHAA